jgi:hypothetical protein
MRPIVWTAIGVAGRVAVNALRLHRRSAVFDRQLVVIQPGPSSVRDRFRVKTSRSARW